MALLLPWIWLLPRDWCGLSTGRGNRPPGGRRCSAGGRCWWSAGWLIYQPGVLDRLKFTQGLVAHSHLAMAGFTTSFCAVLLELVTGRRLGGRRSVVLWNGAALVMVLALAYGGWREGGGYSWMVETPVWRASVFGDQGAMRRRDVPGGGDLDDWLEETMNRLKFMHGWSVAVGAMDAVTGLLLVFAPSLVLGLAGHAGTGRRGVGVLELDRGVRDGGGPGLWFGFRQPPRPVPRCGRSPAIIRLMVCVFLTVKCRRLTGCPRHGCGWRSRMAAWRRCNWAC